MSSQSSHNTNNHSHGRPHRTNNDSGNQPSKGWFEGTMEVISGMEVISHLAPRPSTPVQPVTRSSHAKPSNNRGYMSAPNSPARSSSSFISSFPLINRLPSQDSMDRSVHNETSSVTGGGTKKSTKQVIRELRQSNAAWSEKTAKLEADFMNQLNDANRQAQLREKKLQEQISHRDKIMASLEARCKQAEVVLQERDDQLTKTREESAFQRHTISDLKNELYKMNQELEYNQRDQVDKWQLEKQEMLLELHALRAQVAQPFQARATGDEEEDPLGSSQRSTHSHRSMMSNRSMMDQGLRQTREALKKTKHRLSVTEAALDILKQERGRMVEEHHMEVTELHEHLEAAELTHKQKEDALKKTIQLMENELAGSATNTPSKEKPENATGTPKSPGFVAETAAHINVKQQLEDANATITSLHGQVRQLSAQLQELTHQLAKVKADAASQEQYRADEAEDLRVLHDAQEEEIERLRKELDYAHRELELREQELEEAQKEKEHRSPEEEKKQEVQDVADNTEKKNARIAELEDRLVGSEAAMAELKKALDKTCKERDERVGESVKLLEAATAEKVGAREQLAKLSTVLIGPPPQTSRSIGDGNDQPSTAIDIAVLLRKVEELRQNERKARQELEELRNSRQNETEELELLVVRLKESEERLAATRDGAMEEYRAEIQKLRAQVKVMEGSAKGTSTLEAMLREAQESLNDVDAERKSMVEEHLATTKRIREEKVRLEQQLAVAEGEKKRMIDEHMATLESLQEDKSKLESDFRSRLESREKDIAELKERLKAEVDGKEKREQDLIAAVQENERLLKDHKARLEQLEQDKASMEQTFIAELEAKDAELVNLSNSLHSSATGEPTSDSDVVATLKQEISHLQDQLVIQEQQLQLQLNPEGVIDRQSGGSMEADLRKQLDSVKRSEENLKSALTRAAREKETFVAELKEKLNDRDTTISALVKSSVGLEQKISQLQTELQSHRSRNLGLRNERSMMDSEVDSEELEELREALADYKEVEGRLLQELSIAKKQLAFSESEISRLQELMDDVDGSCGDQHFRRQLQERDDAVSTLVQQSMAQESQIKQLKANYNAATAELEAMRAEKQRTAVQLRTELRRLHQESEIFAGQIIEQDEELEALRGEILARDERIEDLSRQLAESRQKGPHRAAMANPNGETPEVVYLKAEIDELNEANETYRAELRQLRLKVHDYEDITNKLARARYDLEEFHRKSQTALGAQEKLEEATAAQRVAEQQLEELKASMRALSDNSIDIEEKEAVIADLRRNLDGNATQIEVLETEIDSLHQQMKEKAEALEQSELTIKRLEAKLAADQVSAMKNPNGDVDQSGLFYEVEELQNQVQQLEAEIYKLNEFKEKMVEVETIQEQSKKLVDSYERKLSMLTLTKDSTIDSLQKSLIELKKKAADDFDAMSKDLRLLDAENQKTRAELEKSLQEKDMRIFALEQNLDAREQLVGNMRSEMDHLQGSMESTTLNRREEIEEMQKEVLDLTSRATAQEREITSLKMQLEESKLAHMTEVIKLRETVHTLQYQNKSAPDDATKINPAEMFPLHEVKERLEKLRYRNASIQEENFKLKSRLEKAEAEIQAAKNEKYKTASLEAKVESLTKQLRTVESERNVAAKSSGSLRSVQEALDPASEQQMVPRSSSRPSSPQKQKQHPSLEPGFRPGTQSAPGSRSGTPQRKRTPLKTRQGAPPQQQAPDTPSRKLGFFKFGKRKSHGDNSDESRTQAKQKQYLVPPSNPRAPSSEKQLKAPMSSKSLRSSA